MRVRTNKMSETELNNYLCFNKEAYSFFETIKNMPKNNLFRFISFNNRPKDVHIMVEC